MPLTADHIADVAIHTTIAVVAVWQVYALLALVPPRRRVPSAGTDGLPRTHPLAGTTRRREAHG